jgi:hypothetical protein
MEIMDGLSATFIELLDKDNYIAWSVQVKTYLMAQDLWEIIEATTPPPRLEDGEDAFKAWSKKNSMALHVIQISCAPNTFFEIIEISSAKDAWDTLAKRFLHVLDKHNYVDWSVRVKSYLMAQDLWEIIEATTLPPKQEDNAAAFNAWSKKNSMTLRVIQISCGQDAISEIIKISSAKISWDTLAEKYNSGPSLSLPFSLNNAHAQTFYMHNKNNEKIKIIIIFGKSVVQLTIVGFIAGYSKLSNHKLVTTYFFNSTVNLINLIY